MSVTMPWSPFEVLWTRAASTPAPAWLTSARAHARAQFEADGWPSTREEAWRQTSLALVARASYAAAPAGRETDADVVEAVRQLRQDQPGHWLVFVDGRHVPSLSSPGVLPSGARLDSVAAWLRDDPAGLQPYYAHDEAHGSPATLNLALADDGAALVLPAGVALSEPVHWVFLAATPGAARFVRNVLVAGQGARATVVEHHLSLSDAQADAGFGSVSTQVELAADAVVSHVKLQQEAVQDTHLGALSASVAARANYHAHSFSFGAKLARHGMTLRLREPSAHAAVNGLYFVDGQRHVDHHVLVDHAVGACTSEQQFRGILDDAARGVFTGRILVAEGADGTDAIQRADSLLLSRRARADARPELEIYADDVKCTHGATVGQIDEDSLFYLRSRGMDAALAHSVLTYAFAARALASLDDDGVKARASRAIQSLLPAGAHLGDDA